MADAAAPRPKMKKLPFKPTALRKPPLAQASSSPDDGGGSSKKNNDDDDALALFRRSREMAPIVARDQERRRQKMRKQKEAEERRSRPLSQEKRQRDDEDDDARDNEESRLIEAQLRDCVDGGGEAGASFAADESMTGRDSFNELVTPPPSKRTRSGSSPSKKRPVTPVRQSQESPSARQLRSQSKYSTPRRHPQPPRAVTPSRGVPIISLDEDDEDVTPMPTPSKPRDASVEIVDEPEPQTRQVDQSEEDDEFAEYIRKAEEEKRNLTSRASEDPSAPKAPNASILVTSAIPGTRDCGVKSFLDKPLLEIRGAWVSIQKKHGNHIPVDPSELILTWRGSKVYNYSTLHSLGLRSYGDRVVADGHSRKGLSADGMQVHMEVWTPDMFKKWEEEEERRQKVLAGELSDEEAAGDGKEEEPEVTLRVILKARDLDEVRLTVRPATTVETLVTGFRAQSGLGADKEVRLWFDGEVMEEHVTMEGADIEDMDAIEVHIK